MQDITRQCVYSPKWQALRVGLLARWVRSETILDNINKLNEYLESGENNRITRAWRILNLENGVRMGFSGMGLHGSECDRMLVEHRKWIQAEYRRLQVLGEKLQEVSLAQFNEEWHALDEITRRDVFVNVYKRRKLHAESTFRDDLSEFIARIEQYQPKER